MKNKIILHHRNIETQNELISHIGDQYDIVILDSLDGIFEKAKSFKPDLLIIQYEVLSTEMIQQLYKHNYFSTLLIDNKITLSNNELSKLYDYGVVDIITLPIQPVELMQKFKYDLEYIISRTNLKKELNSSKEFASCLLDNIGEFGVVLNFMKLCFSCRTIETLEKGLVQAVKNYNLSACFRLTHPDAIHEFSTDGKMSSIESDLMKSYINSGKIYSFSNHCLINEEHISLFIRDIPIENTKKIGRLKDHLSVIMDAAEEKLIILQRDESDKLHASKMQDGIKELSQVIISHESHLVTMIDGLLEQFNDAIEELDLTEQQTDRLAFILDCNIKNLLSVHIESSDIEDRLSVLTTELDTFISGQSHDSHRAFDISTQKDNEEDDDDVLF